MDRGVRPRHHRVAGLEMGEPVAVYGAWGCGGCQYGRRAWRTTAPTPSAAAPAWGSTAAWPRTSLVPGPRYLVPLGDLDPVQAAPLTDAGLTPYHAIVRSCTCWWPAARRGDRRRRPRPHGRADPAGARARHRDRGRPARGLVRLAVEAGLGADHTVVAGAQATEEIRAITGGQRRRRGARLRAGSTRRSRSAAAVVGPLGHLTCVGIGGGSLPLTFFTVPYECSVQSTYWGSITELHELLALARTGGFQAQVSASPSTRSPRSTTRWTTAPCRAGPTSSSPTPPDAVNPSGGEPPGARRGPVAAVLAAGATGARVGCAFGVMLLRRPASSPGARTPAAAGRRHPGRPRR